MPPNVGNNASHDISCILFNARGLKSKIIELDYELSLLTKLPKVVFICETWLDSSNILGTDVFLLYDVFRKDGNKYGGGVMVMCYKSFNATHLVNYADKIEGVFCEICFKHEKFIVGCIYRPPSAD